MMTYFEIRDRLNNLIEYRKLYREFMSSNSADKGLAARAVREELELMASLASDSLRRVGLASSIAPLVILDSGRRARVDIIKTAFREDLVERYDLQGELVEKVVDSGILKYQRLKWKHKLSLFNPLFWLYHFTSFLALLPVTFAHGPVAAQARLERSQWLQTYVAVVQLAIFFLVLGPVVGALPWGKYLWVALVNFYQH